MLLRERLQPTANPHKVEKVVAMVVMLVMGLLMSADITGQFQLKGLWGALVNFTFALSWFVALSKKPCVVKCN